MDPCPTAMRPSLAALPAGAAAAAVEGAATRATPAGASPDPAGELAVMTAAALDAPSPGGWGAIRVLVSLGHAIPKTKPHAATMPTFPQAGRSPKGAGISTNRGASGRRIG